MADWLYEEGIGEARAILVEAGNILEAAIELPGLRAGAVVPVRLMKILAAGRLALATLEDGSEALVEPLPASTSEGANFLAEVRREPIPEPGRPKSAMLRPSEGPPRPGPSLAERIGYTRGPRPPIGDAFEEAGWSELLEQATRGEMAFPGGNLRMSLTPAMTLFDVDGTLPVDALAVAGAQAAAQAIRRFGITGSIGVDLPTASRDARRRAADAVDIVLPQPFERTAVNGFGFLQIIRPRTRASLPEQLAADPIGAAARALLRRAERSGGTGAATLRAVPGVIARIDSDGWHEELARRIGASVNLQGDAMLSISAGDVWRETV